MSEKVGSEIKRLWFRMTPSPMDVGRSRNSNSESFYVGFVSLRHRFQKMVWAWTTLELNLAVIFGHWNLCFWLTAFCGSHSHDCLPSSMTVQFDLTQSETIYFRFIHHWLWIHPFRASKLDLVHTVLILGDLNPISQPDVSSGYEIEDSLILVQTNCEFVWISPNHRGRGFCFCGDFTGEEIVLKELEDVQTTFRGTYLIFWFLLSHAFQVFDATFKRF